MGFFAGADDERNRVREKENGQVRQKKGKTPGLKSMMQQYVAMKEQQPDCILFFRLVDFYELFFEDGVTAARDSELTLTGRDFGLDERAPMCGVSHHSVDQHSLRLLEK